MNDVFQQIKRSERRMDDLIVINTHSGIANARILSLRSMLGLELKGLSRRGRSAYSIVKAEFGFKGNKQKVYNQLCAHIQKHILQS